jgi:hypothetical protein
VSTIDKLVTANGIVFAGPVNQPNWVTTSGSSYNNIVNVSSGPPYYQSIQLNTATDYLLLAVSTTAPTSTVMGVTVFVQLGTATAFTVAVFSSLGPRLATVTSTAPSVNGWTPVTCIFTTPSSAQTLTIQIGSSAAAVGSSNIYGLTVFTGTSLGFSLLGSLSAASTLSTPDLLYGPSGTSLTSALATLAPLANPTFTGTVHMAALGCTGTVTASSLYSTNTIAADGGITCKGSPQAFSVYNSGAGTVAYFDSVGNLVCGNITGGSLACSGASSFASLSCNNLTVNNAETDAGTLTVNGLLTASGGISATNATLNGTSTIPSGGALNVNTAAINLNTNGYLRFYNGAALQGNLDFGGNLTSSGAVNVTGTVTSGTGVVAPTVTASSTGTSITASGDIKYNGTTSLTSQMATLNGYKTGGTISTTAANTWQTIYTLTSTSRGWLTASVYPGNTFGLAFFEMWVGLTNPSLTTMIPFNSSYISIQLSGTAIQVKTPTAGASVGWAITFM